VSPRLAGVLSRILFAVAAVCFIAGAWLWWNDRPPVSVLQVESPVNVGTLAVDADHFVEIPVTNTGREAIRLVGPDGEEC
jgi:hypothetical protein